jgi:hypothetical protein
MAFYCGNYKAVINACTMDTTEILVLNLATEIDRIGLQKFEDLKRIFFFFFFFSLRNNIVFGRLQIISSIRLLSDGVSPIETMKNEPVTIVVCGEVWTINKNYI